ncbi:MAG: nitroreductase [Muribaculaceae bacterium]|nr:nitroreductase [Muribaculaceae bacterium]
MDNKERTRLLEAIKNRHSVRRYKSEPIPEDILALLRAKIDELNAAGNLHIQLVVNEPRGFNGPLAYGQFSGVENYFIVAGKKDDTFDERAGYYGEQLVLYAQTLGLNTCWAGLSYKKIPGTYDLDDGEKISCYISLGYGVTQGVAHKIKTPEQVSNVGDSTPAWFLDGVKAALLAPTAINQQKFSFEYVAPSSPGDKARVVARKGFSLVGYTRVDLGIAKCHFEIGADPSNFDWA